MRRLLVFALLFALACGGEKYDSEREVAMRQSLVSMRSAITRFRQDKQRNPYSLEELVPEYLRAIPVDPITHKNEWRVVMEEPVAASNDFSTAAPAEPQRATVIDVRSSAPGKDRQGLAWSAY